MLMFSVVVFWCFIFSACVCGVHVPGKRRPTQTWHLGSELYSQHTWCNSLLHRQATASGPDNTNIHQSFNHSSTVRLHNSTRFSVSMVSTGGLLKIPGISWLVEIYSLLSYSGCPFALHLVSPPGLRFNLSNTLVYVQIPKPEDICKLQTSFCKKTNPVNVSVLTLSFWAFQHVSIWLTSAASQCSWHGYQTLCPVFSSLTSRLRCPNEQVPELLLP